MYLFIVNAYSGNGRGKRVWSQVEAQLIQRAIPYRAIFTQAPRHATDIARSAATRSDIHAVVAIGGDGTVHEVGNGLIETDMPLGYIQAGSGNDFAMAQAIPTDPLHALERILQHRIRRIDTAKLNGRSLVGFSGMGFDGLVAHTVNHSSAKRWLGKMVYAYAAFQTWFAFQPARATLLIDGEHHVFPDLWLIAVTNIPNYGGGMMVCPGADVQDGLLDICCVHGISHGEFLRVFPSVFKGNHTRHPSVTMMRGKAITVEADPTLTVHADGEVIGETPLSIQVQPQSLSIL
jgi:diacylglycerol kinase (ATP)